MKNKTILSTLLVCTLALTALVVGATVYKKSKGLNGEGIQRLEVDYGQVPVETEEKNKDNIMNSLEKKDSLGDGENDGKNDSKNDSKNDGNSDGNRDGMNDGKNAAGDEIREVLEPTTRRKEERSTETELPTYTQSQKDIGIKETSISGENKTDEGFLNKDKLDSNTGDDTNAKVQSVDQEVTPGVHFSENNTLVWPMKGEILIPFDMEHTVLFKTLNQYKCSNAMVIKGEINSKIVAPSDALVSEVATSEEYGNFVRLNLGDGYEIVIGQLKDIKVHEGDVVEASQIIGYLEKTTKYYVEEGDNLFLQMRSGKKYVNPVKYLEKTE